MIDNYFSLHAEEKLLQIQPADACMPNFQFQPFFFTYFQVQFFNTRSKLNIRKMEAQLLFDDLLHLIFTCTLLNSCNQ
jgi:hypothetical protein